MRESVYKVFKQFQNVINKNLEKVATDFLLHINDILNFFNDYNIFFLMIRFNFIYFKLQLIFVASFKSQIFEETLSI